MVVIAIIAVLLSVVLPNLSTSRARAKHAACIANLKHLGSALQVYSNDCDGDFPDDLDQLMAGNPASLGRIMTCPSNESSYQTLYQVNHSTRRYTLVCNGVHHLQLESCSPGYPQYMSTGSLLTGPDQ